MPANESKWWTKPWNPIRYLDGWMCTKISPGCANCYAEVINKRFGNKRRYGDLVHTEFRLDEKILVKPLHWRKPQRIFVMEMGDLFHEQIPDIFINKMFAIMALCPQHTFLSLTKRPERMIRWFGRSREYIWKKYILPEVDKIHSPWQSPCRYVWPLSNLWLGVTVESERYLWRINELIENVPAAHKFVSLEPMLEEFRIGEYVKHPDWVVVGAETGPGARPCKIEWLESIVDQCDEANVPVWVKAVPINGRISHDPAEWPQWARKRELAV